MLSKIAMSRAFCQLMADPGGKDLLGLQQDYYFKDQSVQFEYRHTTGHFCQPMLHTSDS